MELRNDIRTTVDYGTDVRVQGRRAKAVIYNLSTRGCMLEFFGSAAAPDERVVISLPGHVLAPGRSVWSIGLNSGIHFERALHPAVVTYLGFASSSMYAESPVTDRFGRILPGLSKHWLP